jgi:hypothetical protein
MATKAAVPAAPVAASKPETHVTAKAPAAGARQVFAPKNGDTPTVHEKSPESLSVRRTTGKQRVEKAFAAKREAEAAKAAEGTGAAAGAGSGDNATPAVEPGASPPKEAADEGGVRPVEKKPETKPEEKPELRQQFAKLAEYERRLQGESTKLKGEREQMKSEREALERELAPLRDLKKLLDGDKYEALDKLGIDVNEWARRRIGKPPLKKETDPEAAELRKRLDQLEADRKKEKEERETSDAKSRYEGARKNALAEIDQFVQDKGESFALIRTKKANEVVFATIEAHFEQSGKLLSLEEACILVEQHFEEDAKSYLGVPKIAKLAPQGAASPGGAKPELRGKKPSSKPQTLTNDLDSTAPDRVPATRSREERRKAVRAHFAGRVR